ncbi:MAG: LuxR family transcriptional regulator [Coxiella sp. RIFCSPHIGHO2_12_FULL_42_15]|nr:MAG: LuxR family transcriptional regulator [Coxiella sp. RIFCSPHIGHO2_12_FULL_42_15]
MKIKNILVLLPILALTGCADKPKFVDLSLNYITTDSAPVKSVDQSSQAQLAEAAQSVNQSLAQLSAIQLATNPGIKMPEPANASAIGMAQQTSLDWTGPVEPLLKKIADASGYTVNVLGNQPPIPVIVVINAYDQPLATILRDTTYQVSKKARIEVYPDKKIIELRYL